MPRNEPNKTAIYATTVTAFFAIAGIAIVDPILPAIGKDFGASIWQIELLFTAYIAVMAIGMIPAVMLTGKFGYKKILAAGVSIVAVAAGLAAASVNIGQLAALRGLWGLGNALFMATAMVLLVSLANDRSWAVELFETCVGLGFAIGPLIGGLLGEWSWRAPFGLCAVFMVISLALSVTKLKDPAEMPAPLRFGHVFRPFRKPGFVLLSIITGAYNFVFFIVLGYTPVFLRMDVVPLGLVFTAWGVGLAIGILLVGHKLAHKFGAVQTIGGALVVLLVAMLGIVLADESKPQIVAFLVVAGLAMGIMNANLTDLALATGSPDRRVTTGAFNLVRWGFAAPAPVVAGLLAEHVSLASPYWVGIGVLVVGMLTYAFGAHVVAHGAGERVAWVRKMNDRAEAVEGSPAEAMELV